MYTWIRDVSRWTHGNIICCPRIKCAFLFPGKRTKAWGKKFFASFWRGHIPYCISSHPLNRMHLVPSFFSHISLNLCSCFGRKWQENICIASAAAARGSGFVCVCVWLSALELGEKKLLGIGLTTLRVSIFYPHREKGLSQIHHF